MTTAQGSKRGSAEKSEGASEKGAQFKPPLTPRRGLLWVSSAILVLWVAVLLVTYFVTVYPQRHGKDAKPEAPEIDSKNQ